jgi:hypothetical protein
MLIFVIFKGIVQLCGGGAKGSVNSEACDGEKDATDADTKNCCRFHKLKKN